MGGWGNGYVIIPEGHKLNGVHYDNIDVDVHYGLTFSEPAKSLDWAEISDEDSGGWIVGFDTLHYGDDINKWPMEAVEAETERLKEQLEAQS